MENLTKTARRVVVCIAITLGSFNAYAGWFDFLYELKVNLDDDTKSRIDAIVLEMELFRNSIDGMPLKFRVEFQQTFDRLVQQLYGIVDRAEWAALNIVETAIRDVSAEATKLIMLASEEARKNIDHGGKTLEGVIDLSSEKIRTIAHEFIEQLDTSVKTKMELGDLIAARRVDDFFIKLQNYTSTSSDLFDQIMQARMQQGFDESKFILQEVMVRTDAGLAKFGIILNDAIDNLNHGLGLNIDKAIQGGEKMVEYFHLGNEKNIRIARSEADEFTENTFVWLVKLGIITVLLIFAVAIGLQVIAAKQPLNWTPTKVAAVGSICAVALFFLTQPGTLSAVVDTSSISPSYPSSVESGVVTFTEILSEPDSIEVALGNIE